MTDTWWDRHPVLAVVILALAVLILFGAFNGPPDSNAPPAIDRPQDDPAYGPHGAGN